MLLSKRKLSKLKSINFDMCESCILGKQKKVSFLKIGRTPKAEKLELAASFYSYCFCERVLGCNWDLGFLRVFQCNIVSPYFIVKSLQFRGRRAIAEPRKYCLVHVIIFFGVCFLYLFYFSQVGILVKFPTGGRVVFPNCSFRYELYPFYRMVATAPTPSPGVQSSPPPSPSSVSGPKGKVVHPLIPFELFFILDQQQLLLLRGVNLCQHFTDCFLEELYLIHSTIVYNNMYFSIGLILV